MILIKHVDYIEIPGDMAEIYHAAAHDQPLFGETPEGPEYLSVEVKREMVRGICIRRSDGEDIVIGASRQVGEILGTYHQAHEDLLSAFDFYRRNTDILRKNLEAVSNASLWQRIQWVFTGVEMPR